MIRKKVKIKTILNHMYFCKPTFFNKVSFDYELMCNSLLIDIRD